MRALSAAELLAVWELALNQPATQRSLALLAACSVDTSPGELAQLSIGEGDERLLSLRERTFGSQLAAIAACPMCKEALEFAIDIADIRMPSRAAAHGTLAMDQGDYHVDFRLPNNLDIASLDPEADRETNRRQLLSRCVVVARRAGADVAAAELPLEIVTAIADRMAEADPQADVQFALCCPECGHDWTAPLDITSFLWTELNTRAIGLLNDVHRLASAYGWSEADILSMNAARRQTYLELLSQ